MNQFTPPAGLKVVLACMILAISSVTVADEPVDFSREIKPLLTKRCLVCHGPDENSREAGLRLDTFDGATEDLGGYQALTPGDWKESELYRRITSDDESEVMPPPGHGEPLTLKEKDQIKRWILSGAKYEIHWSYQMPVETKRPAILIPEWPVNPIDEFVLHRMSLAGLTPSPPANRLAIARRVALDLTGLPPTLEQADAFANDPAPDAYEKMVDRLLASSAYGEHWAAMWLDLARYADSAGFAEDKLRTIWPYRDYVIRSFQANKPFDQFTVEQIAGDQLTEPTSDQMIATAFHRNTLTNSEGGTDDEEFRSAAIVDRTNTTMAVWMGTTMACAQCHTHKYDPISQKEYFQVYALLNGTQDNDQPDEKPILDVYSKQQQIERDGILERLKAANARLDRLNSKSASSPIDIPSPAQRLWEAAIQEKDVPQPLAKFVRIDIEGPNKILSLAEVQVFSKQRNVALSGTATQSSLDYGGKPEFAIDGNFNGQFDIQSTTHTRISKNPWWQVDLGAPVTIDRISIWNRTDANLHRRLDGFRVSILDANQNTIWSQQFKSALAKEQEIHPRSVPREIETIVLTPVKQRTDSQSNLLKDYYSDHAGPAHQIKLQIVEIQQLLSAIEPISTVPIMRELIPEKKRKTRIQIRGSYRDLGEQVHAATPAAFHPLHASASDRLGFARWLVDPRNPLTARVTVNRYWQQLFGVGLVRTSEDFGAQGDLPSHPELLDYLAVKFIADDWDTRSILKQIVMSSTYRQASRATAEHRKTDPTNRWLSRGPRFRVSAEIVRDQALFSSGLLSKKMYGPPVQPPGPKLGLKAAFSGEIKWETSPGEDRYRRAIYTQWRRSSPYPSMETFDVSNREVCDLRRISTNTPLQALVTLNDPVFVEAARALARRAINSNSDPQAIARRAFRLVLIRNPTAKELDELIRLYTETKSHFTARPQQAKIFVQDATHPPADVEHAIELASWTTVANVILNLDELFSKR